MHASCSPWHMGPAALKFSPDSTRIRFNVWNEKENSYSIWEIRTDGTNLHPLLPGWRNPPSECCGVWSPDGRYFLFLSDNRLLGGGNIWALQESNSAFRKYPSRLFQLTAGPMLFSAMTAEPRRQEAVRGRLPSSRRTHPLRCTAPRVCALSVGNLGD